MGTFFSDFLSPGWGSVLRVIDILLVAYIIYRLLKLVRGTRAWRIGVGIGFFVLALFLSDWAGLQTLHWLLDKFTLLGPVALVILFLPELRQAVEGIGKLGLWTSRIPGASGDTSVAARTIETLVTATIRMAEERIGALIVIERSNKLEDVAGNGVAVDAELSAPLLTSIFYNGNPLHDGAVVVRQDRIIAAACRLPLSENPNMDEHLHMRHRAGAGISEQSDAVTIIVSEERGQVTVAIEGRLNKCKNAADLRDILNGELRGIWPDKPKRHQQRRERIMKERERRKSERDGAPSGRVKKGKNED